MELLSPIVVVLINLIWICYYMILVSNHCLERCYVFSGQLAEVIVSYYFYTAEARSCKAMEHFYLQLE